MNRQLQLSTRPTDAPSFRVAIGRFGLWIAIAAAIAIGPGRVASVRADDLRNCEESGALVCPERGSDLQWNPAPIPYVIAPRRTSLLDRRPTFAWARVPDAERYTIELIDIATGEILFSVLAPATIDRLVYPETLPDLSPDTIYSLEVTADTGAASWQAELNGGITFDVLPDDRVAEYAAAMQDLADADDAVDPVAIAELQREFDLYQLAAETYRTALESETLTREARAELLLRSAELYWHDLELVPAAAVRYAEAYAIAPTAALAEQLGTAALLLGDRDRALEYWDAAIASYLTIGDDAAAQRVRAERDRIRGAAE